MSAIRRMILLSATTLITAASLLTAGVMPAGAAESPPRIAELTDAVLSFDLSERIAHAAAFELADGTQVQLGAEPVTTGLDGTWHVWGDNGSTTLSSSRPVEFARQ